MVQTEPPAFRRWPTRRRQTSSALRWTPIGCNTAAGTRPNGPAGVSGRIPCVDSQDMTVVGSENRMAAVGAGNLNFRTASSSACESGGTHSILIEQDNCYGEDPFDCLRQSYEYLKSMGLE